MPLRFNRSAPTNGERSHAKTTNPADARKVSDMRITNLISSLVLSIPLLAIPAPLRSALQSPSASAHRFVPCIANRSVRVPAISGNQVTGLTATTDITGSPAFGSFLRKWVFCGLPGTGHFPMASMPGTPVTGVQ